LGRFRGALRRRAIVQMVVIGTVAGIATGGIAYFIPWLPDQASREASKIDGVYWFVTIICALIFALVAGVSLYAGWKFRAPPDDMDDGSPIHGHTGLEITWTAIPAALVVAMSVFSGVVLAQVEDIPDDHRVVRVTGQQFAWKFTYPELGDITDGDLVLEANRPVELLLTAEDVIHSFWVPEFRMKQDAVPGVETRTVVTPTKTGTYDVICTELCGLGHSVMRARARVLSAEEYERWAAEARQAGQEGGGETETGEGEGGGETTTEEEGGGG
jgi:cytochrome c oxidase subunit 2